MLRGLFLGPAIAFAATAQQDAKVQKGPRAQKRNWDLIDRLVAPIEPEHNRFHLPNASKKRALPAAMGNKMSKIESS